MLPQVSPFLSSPLVWFAAQQLEWAIFVGFVRMFGSGASDATWIIGPHFVKQVKRG